MSLSRLSLFDIVANPPCDVSPDDDRQLHAERARSPDTVPKQRRSAESGRRDFRSGWELSN